MSYGIYSKSPKINIEEVRALSKLEGQALEKKNLRDQELEAIITWRRPANSLGNWAMLI